MSSSLRGLAASLVSALAVVGVAAAAPAAEPAPVPSPTATAVISALGPRPVAARRPPAIALVMTPVYTFNGGGADQRPASGGSTHHEVQLNYTATFALAHRWSAYYTHFNVDPTPERVFIRGRPVYPGAVSEYYSEVGVSRTLSPHVAVDLGYRERVHQAPVNDADTSCTSHGNCGVNGGYHGPLVSLHLRYGPYGPLGATFTYNATVIQVLRTPLAAVQKTANALHESYSPGLPILNTNLLGVALTRYRPLQPFIQVGTQADEFSSKIHPTTENIVWFGVVHPFSRDVALTVSDFNFRGTHQGVTFPGAETTRFNVVGAALSYRFTR